MLAALGRDYVLQLHDVLVRELLEELDLAHGAQREAQVLLVYDHALQSHFLSTLVQGAVHISIHAFAHLRQASIVGQAAHATTRRL